MGAALKWTGRIVALVVAYIVLFAVGSHFLGPDLSALPAAPVNAGMALAALVVIALVDVAILLAVVLTSRLSGAPLILLLAFLIYAVKTFTSGIEAWYFITNVTPAMIPGLFTMTVPLVVLFPPLAVWVCGKMSPDLAETEPAWQLPGRGPADFALRIAVLGAFVYPALFFSFGYFVAWQSPEVRAFYGDSGAPTFIQQMAIVFSNPMTYPFEVMRGVLWVLFALPVLATTRGRWWVGTLLVALAFALIQNDVHLVPNPLMPPVVRLYHFIETGSSNFIWAWAIGFLLARRGRAGVSPQPMAR